MKLIITLDENKSRNYRKETWTLTKTAEVDNKLNDATKLNVDIVNKYMYITKYNKYERNELWTND